jgi:hypothetical protein
MPVKGPVFPLGRPLAGGASRGIEGQIQSRFVQDLTLHSAPRTSKTPLRARLIDARGRRSRMPISWNLGVTARVTSALAGPLVASAPAPPRTVSRRPLRERVGRPVTLSTSLARAQCVTVRSGHPRVLERTRVSMRQVGIDTTGNKPTRDRTYESSVVDPGCSRRGSTPFANCTRRHGCDRSEGAPDRQQCVDSTPGLDTDLVELAGGASPERVSRRTRLR